MPLLARKNTWRIHLLAVAMLLIGCASIVEAVRWYGHPFAGIFVDPDLTVSSIGWPTWDGIRQGLRFPNRILSIDGESLTGPRGEMAALAWDRAVDRAVAAGHESVHVRVATDTGDRELDLAIETLNPAAWWVNAGCLIFAAALYTIAGILALLTSPRGKLARTFALTAIITALFLLTVFDLHTTRALVPILFISFPMMSVGLVTLPLRLPDDVPLVRRYPWIIRAIRFVGASLAVALLVRHAAHRETTQLRVVCSMLFGGSLIFFVGTMIVRLILARGERRARMTSVFAPMVPVHGLLGVGVLVTMLTARGSTLAFCALPAVALSPLATLVAFIRHDLWGSRALLSRVLTNVVVGMIACAFAIGIGAAVVASFDISFMHALLSVATGGVLSAVIVTFALRASDRGFFPSRAEYKPTIAHLSEELTALKDPEAVAADIERSVHRWLAAERVTFTLTRPEDEFETISEISSSATEELTLSVDFGGSRLGVLRVGKKKGGALFTSEDVDLLKTIAHQAAVAIAQAHSYRELEERRQQQAAAWRGERLALIETLTAEIAHEIRYPINYFRSVFYRNGDNGLLDPEDLDIGREEVERLERLVAGLRRLSAGRLERRSISLMTLVTRAEVLLRDALGSRQLDLAIPDGVNIRCDLDQTLQIVVNLVSNALDATNDTDRVGIEWSPQGTGGELAIWDTGKGFDGDATQLFAPWFTTKPKGTGLGLAITQRIVRAHGWNIDARRERGRTRFAIIVPGSDISEAPPRAVTEVA